jgi:glycosyltransferase involved in cell wall biosynthesis
MITAHRFITVQSSWLEAQIKAINANCTVFYNDFALREPFCESSQWQFSGRPIVFCTAAYPAPFKGLHIATRAIALIRRHIPSVMLRIAGSHGRKGIRRDGYIAWVDREIRRLKIDNHVEWLGPLSAKEIVVELQNCSAFVLPSFIEGYCVGLAEAMMVGAPSVVSFAGGAPALAIAEESAIFFPPGDEAMCAYELIRVLTDRALAESLSASARKVAFERNDVQKIIDRQLEIYEDVIAGSISGIE